MRTSPVRSPHWPARSPTARRWRSGRSSVRSTSRRGPTCAPPSTSSPRTWRWSPPPRTPPWRSPPSARSAPAGSSGADQQWARGGPGKEARMTFAGFDLPDDLRLLRDTVADFVREEIVPVEAGLPGDARGLPVDDLRTLQAKAREAGFWCLEAPEEYGGGGLGVFEGGGLVGQMAKHRYSFPRPGAGVFGSEPPNVLYRGSPRQIEEYVRPTIENAWTAFSAISEPTGGSDPARAIRSVA